MPGPVVQWRSRQQWRRYYVREVGRDLGHRLLLLVVFLFLVGLGLHLVVPVR